MTDEIILSTAEACGLLNDCLDVETMSVCILAFTKFMVGVELFKEREALAQEQEPVAWMYQEYRDDDQFGWRDEILFTEPPNDPMYFRNITPVYITPPQRTWVGLTEEEIKPCWHEACQTDLELTSQLVVYFGKAIEAKLKEKNNA
jgi:hypothetical protein